MTRRWTTIGMRRLGMAVAGFAIAGAAFLVYASQSSARQGAALVRGNKPGEWRYWAADAWSTRYSALDQINANNFDSLQVAWQWKADQYGEDEYYRTTPLYANGRLLTVATNRRKAFAIDPSTGATLWQWGIDEGIRWQKAPRQFAGRGLAYWTDGPNERVIVVTPGYHLASIDAKTGKGDPKFGTDGVVDLMTGLGYPLVPLAVDDSGPLIISEAAPARKAKPGEKWNATTKTGADGTMGIDPANGQIANSSPLQEVVMNLTPILTSSNLCPTQAAADKAAYAKYQQQHPATATASSNPTLSGIQALQPHSAGSGATGSASKSTLFLPKLPIK